MEDFLSVVRALLLGPGAVVIEKAADIFRDLRDVWSNLKSWLTQDMIDTGFAAPGAVSLGHILAVLPFWAHDKFTHLFFDWLLDKLLRIKLPCSDYLPHELFGYALDFHFGGDRWAIGDAIRFLTALFFRVLDYGRVFIDTDIMREALPCLVTFWVVVVGVAILARLVLRLILFFVASGV